MNLQMQKSQSVKSNNDSFNNAENYDNQSNNSGSFINQNPRNKFSNHVYNEGDQNTNWDGIINIPDLTH